MPKKNRKSFKKLWRYMETLERHSSSHSRELGEIYLALQEFHDADDSDWMKDGDHGYSKAMAVEIVFHLFYLLHRGGVSYKEIEKTIAWFTRRGDKMNRRFRAKW